MLLPVPSCLVIIIIIIDLVISNGRNLQAALLFNLVIGRLDDIPARWRVSCQVVFIQVVTTTSLKSGADQRFLVEKARLM